MALTKVTYTDEQTVITAKNLNDIQDELINKCVTVDSRSTAFTDAQKAQARTNIDAVSVTDAKVLVLTVSSVSSLPRTVANTNITDDMVVVNSTLSDPTAQMDNWTVTTATGSLTISGTVSGTTNITLYLSRAR